jgi:hypothetical protein
MSCCYWYFQGFDGGDGVGICAIAELSNKLALEMNSKTETTRAMSKKRRTSDRPTVIAAFDISPQIPSDCLQPKFPAFRI